MQLPFLPPQGVESMPRTVDKIFLALLLLSLFFTSLVVGIIIVAAVRYRRRSRDEFGRGRGGNPKLEWGGMAFLGVLSLGMFLWAGGSYINMFNPPPDAEPIFITGRMWMWKAQHQNGQRENQHAAPPGRQALQAGHDLGGRHPRLLRAGVPHPHRRGARPVHDAVVHADQVGHLPALLLAVLRHGALRSWTARSSSCRRRTYQAWSGGGGPGDDGGGAGRSCSSSPGASAVTRAAQARRGLTWRACSASRSSWRTARRRSPTRTTSGNRS